LLDRCIQRPVPRHRSIAFDPLLSAAEADEMVRVCERFGSYKMYSEERLEVESPMATGLPERYDAAKNFVESGGRLGRKEPVEKLAARTNYFRETYAYGEEIRAAGVEPFLHHAGFVEAARSIHGRAVIEPAIVYANLLLPGQELAVHTDVPEFRGANRKHTPQWLLVVMHHSGLFAEWRMPIATAVSWFHDCRGGEFAFYPDGPEGPAVAQPVRFNSAILLDTDTVFHGVDRVAEPQGEIAPLHPGMRLVPDGGGAWRVVEGERTVASYRWEEMRFSVSWKAYCFRDESERRAWSERRDDLTLEFIVDRLLADLRGRGRAGSDRPSNLDLALLLIDEYVKFPRPMRGQT
jgi:hypothetical protein